MALFDWLKTKPAAPQSSVLPPDGLTVPPAQEAPVRQTLPPVEDDLKTQRQERREHLYAVVRDVMLRSEVLASRYKFKVLSLDVRGRQFLIMVDLLDASDLPSSQFMDVERLIAATAAQQHDLQIKAVYWRVTHKVEATPHEPKAQVPASASHLVHKETSSAKPAFEPISQDEVLAFHQAVAAGTALKPATVFAPKPASQPQPLTGYEDTQLLETEDAGSPLSRTQFGGL